MDTPESPRIPGGRASAFDALVKFHFEKPPPGYFWVGLLAVLLLVGLPVGVLWSFPEIREEIRDYVRELRRKEPATAEIEKNPKVPIPVPAKKPVQKAPVTPKQPPPEQKQVPAKPEPKTEVTTIEPPRTYRSLKRGGFDVWREIELGTKYTNAASALKVLDGKVDVTRAAKKTLRERMSREIGVRTLAITKVTVAELGFAGTPHLLDIIERAKERRLREVPFDAMPQIALEYSGERNLFFGTKILGKERANQLAMVVSDSEYDEEIALLRTSEQKSTWTSESLDLTFKPGAIFLFVLPD